MCTVMSTLLFLKGGRDVRHGGGGSTIRRNGAYVAFYIFVLQAFLAQPICFRDFVAAAIETLRSTNHTVFCWRFCVAIPSVQELPSKGDQSESDSWITWLNAIPVSASRDIPIARWRDSTNTGPLGPLHDVTRRAVVTVC